jgi:hypothetical protein
MTLIYTRFIYTIYRLKCSFLYCEINRFGAFDWALQIPIRETILSTFTKQRVYVPFKIKVLYKYSQIFIRQTIIYLFFVLNICV